MKLGLKDHKEQPQNYHQQIAAPLTCLLSTYYMSALLDATEHIPPYPQGGLQAICNTETDVKGTAIRIQAGLYAYRRGPLL